MKKLSLLTLACIVFSSLSLVTTDANAFTHPGILNSQADLDRTKSKVAAGVSPWSTAYSAFSVQNSSSYSPSPVANESQSNGNFALRADATAAYQNALQWYIGGDPAYAASAINIINSWCTTLQTFDSTDDITAYITALKFAAAGEILRYESGSGWTTTNTTNLQNFLLTKIYPALVNSSGTLVATDGGQGIGCMRGLMAIAIFCNDTAKYNTAVNLYEGNSNSIDPCVAVTYYIDSNGCSGESGRDQAHPQGALASYAEICKMAEIQGLDLWSWSNNRLMAGFEYIARYNLGNNVTWSNHGTCNTSYGSLSTIDRGFFNMMYEMAYNHYVALKGLSMPYTTQVLAIIRPEDGASDDPGFGTLLYTLNAGTVPNYEGTFKVTAVNSGKAIGTVSGDTTAGTNIEQRTYAGAATQQWRMLPLGNEYYRFYLASNPANVIDSGASPTRANVDVHLWGNGGGANQEWKASSGNGGLQMTSRDSIVMDMPVVNLVWDINSNSTADGALLDMSTVNGATNQSFTLTPIYPRTAASAYSTQSGVSLENSSEGGQDVCFINNGDYTAYNSMNVSGATQVAFRVGSAGSGGTIEVHQGSAIGTLLGTATVTNTGAWQTYGTIYCALSGASGTQNIYLVFKGGSGNLFNLLWFTFE